MFCNIDAVPADFLKNFFVLLIGLVGGAAAVAAVYGRFSRSGQKREVSGGPVAVTGQVDVVPKSRRFNAEMCDGRHVEVTRRLDGHDKEITNIWNTMRAEDKDIRVEMEACFKSIERSLGRIEGQLSGGQRQREP